MYVEDRDVCILKATFVMDEREFLDYRDHGAALKDYQMHYAKESLLQALSTQGLIAVEDLKVPHEAPWTYRTELTLKVIRPGTPTPLSPPPPEPTLKDRWKAAWREIAAVTAEWWTRNVHPRA